MRKTILTLTLILMIIMIVGCTQSPTQNETSQQNQEDTKETQTKIESVSNTGSAKDLLPAKATFSEPVPNTGNAIVKAGERSITITFKNNRPGIITLPLTGEASKYSKVECKNPTLIAKYKGEPVEALTTKIEPGDTFTITWYCQEINPAPIVGANFSADLRFNYKQESNGMVYGQLGSVNGPYN